MAFRSKAWLGVIALWSGVMVAAAEFPVTHKHMRRDEPGLLKVNADGIEYVETKKHDDPHDFRWRWDDVQRLVLRMDALEITTYKDVKWLAGKDQKFLFTGKDLQRVYPLVSDKLPRRLVPEIAVQDGLEKIAELPAKRLDGRSGTEGLLLVGRDRLVFQSDARGGSHTWSLDEVDNISSADPLELTVSSVGADYRLQLKRPLPQGLYQDLWRKLNVRRNH